MVATSDKLAEGRLTVDALGSDKLAEGRSTVDALGSDFPPSGSVWQKLKGAIVGNAMGSSPMNKGTRGGRGIVGTAATLVGAKAGDSSISGQIVGVIVEFEALTDAETVSPFFMVVGAKTLGREM